MTVQTALAIERFPDQSAVAYCGPCAVVLAQDDPGVRAISPDSPWSISLYHEADQPIVVFVAPEPAEAGRLFTGVAEHLAAFDGSTDWIAHIGAIGCSAPRGGDESSRIAVCPGAAGYRPLRLKELIMTYHTMRIWGVSDEPSAPELAAKLAHRSWTTCTGFRHAGYLFLNDATSENGAQEYAVVKEATGQQVESLTVSWMEYPRVLAHITAAVRGEYDDQQLGTLTSAAASTPGEHGRCHACA